MHCRALILRYSAIALLVGCFVEGSWTVWAAERSPTIEYVSFDYYPDTHSRWPGYTISFDLNAHEIARNDVVGELEDCSKEGLAHCIRGLGILAVVPIYPEPGKLEIDSVTVHVEPRTQKLALLGETLQVWEIAMVSDRRVVGRYYFSEERGIVAFAAMDDGCSGRAEYLWLAGRCGLFAPSECE